MKNLIKLILPMTLLFYIGVSVAQSAPPVVTLQKVANKMLSSLEANKAAIKHNPKKVKAIVRQVLLPVVYIDGMSRAVVGRQYWMKATKAQRDEFNKQFTQLVINTYATPLANYQGDKITFLPMRNYHAGMKSGSVYSRILRPTGQKIQLTYRMVKVGDKWKVYDFSVDGVSMVQSYRSQFANVLQTAGMGGLITRLQEHNRRK